MKFVWSTILNDVEDRTTRASLRSGESVYAFVKIAIAELATRRARGESDGNGKSE